MPAPGRNTPTPCSGMWLMRPERSIVPDIAPLRAMGLNPILGLSPIARKGAMSGTIDRSGLINHIPEQGVGVFRPGAGIQEIAVCVHEKTEAVVVLPGFVG